MTERLLKIWNKVLQWWKKFERRQQIIIISTVGTVLVAFVILGVVVTSPTMVTLKTCENITEAASVKEALDSSGYAYTISEDGLSFKVNKSDLNLAEYALNSASITTDDYTIDDVVNGSFSTTEADKNKKYQVYKEQKIKDQLEALTNIKEASVSLTIPEDDGTVLAQNEEGYACVVLETTDPLDEDVASGIAHAVATSIGNESTKNITILDSDSNLLFAGGDAVSGVGTASSQLSLKSKTENMVTTQIKNAVLGSKLYNNVEVGLNLDLDFDKVVEEKTEYSVADGKDEGYLDSKSVYTSESSGGTAAVPGTDSNDETSYVVDSGDSSTSSISDSTFDYLPNKTITSTESAIGAIDKTTSSVSVVANQYKIFDEDTLKASGELDDMTFDEYKVANSDKVAMDVDDSIITSVQKATGFDEANISVTAYQVPVFVPSDDSGFTFTDYAAIALVVLILLMLGYVVIRSTRSNENEEMEPEVSVDSLLESTKESMKDLEDIGYNEKSDTRIMIEKFVDEKPEAVAALLRNWLEEEWD